MDKMGDGATHRKTAHSRARGHTAVTVPAAGHPADQCLHVSEVLARVGSKWSVLVISRLGGGPRRFNELKREVQGISQRMLTLTLRGLERDGLVARTVTPSIPPRVDYALTDLGRSLLEPVSALGRWAIANRALVEGARRAFDAESPGPGP